MVKIFREEGRSSAIRGSKWERYLGQGGRNLTYVGCLLCVKIFACYLIPKITLE